MIRRFAFKSLIRKFTFIYKHWKTLKKSTRCLWHISSCVGCLLIFDYSLVSAILTTIFMLSSWMLHTLITYCSHNNPVYLEMSLLSGLGKASYWFFWGNNQQLFVYSLHLQSSLKWVLYFNPVRSCWKWIWNGIGAKS